MSPEIFREDSVKQEKAPEQYPLTIEVFENAESATSAVATKLLERVARTEKELKIGISHGDALNQVIDNFVVQIKEKIERGERIDLSKIQFVQMEALFPESKDSPVNKFAYTLETKLVKPLEQLGLKINIYYPGESGKSFEETLAEYRELISSLDIDMVSVNTSGDARAFRDANYNPETGEAKYVLGSREHYDVVVRPFAQTDYDPQITRLGGKVFTRPAGDVPSRELFIKLEQDIDKAIAAGDTTTKKSEYLLTEGIGTYKKAKEVWVVTSGDKKQTAVKRMFKNVKIEEMPAEERKKRQSAFMTDKEGRCSTAALIETRRGINTWIVLDSSAVGEYDFDNIQNNGAHLIEHK